MTRTRAIIAVALAGSFFLAGCAANPKSDDELAHTGPTCPASFTLKCTRRTAQEDECVCVKQTDVEHTVRTLIN